MTIESTNRPPLLELCDVGRVYVSGGLLNRRRVRAVHGVGFTLDAGMPEILAIIGESGSGKTTLARMILNIIPPSSGGVRFRGRPLHSHARLDLIRQVQPIFQNPFEAFNPLTRVERYLHATARRFAAGDAWHHIGAALQRVGLSAAEVRGRFPHELSGGQLQRIAIARALIPSPALLVADEPVSMVDASLRMSIVKLFAELRDRLGMSIIYITHDLATAYTISDRIVVMRQGSVVESGAARAVLDSPQHPYTRLLKSAVLSI